MQRARDCLIWTKEQKRSSAWRECRRHNEIEAGNGVAMNAESILKGYQKSSKK
jgi:hypothetical protein